MKDTGIDLARGKRIRYVRTEILNLRSQLAMAEWLGGVTRGAVGNWERGMDISLDNLASMSSKASVPFDWLAFGRGPQPEARGSAGRADASPTYEQSIEAALTIFGELAEPAQKEFLRRALGLEELDRSSPGGSAAPTKDDESPR